MCTADTPSRNSRLELSIGKTYALGIEVAATASQGTSAFHKYNLLMIEMSHSTDSVGPFRF